LPLEPLDGFSIETHTPLSSQPFDEAIPVKEEGSPTNSPVENVIQQDNQPDNGKEEDWLSDLESPVTPIQTPHRGEDFLEWLTDPETSETPVESPGVGEYPAKMHDTILPAEPISTSGPEAPGWVDENIPVPGSPIPTSAEEWVPAEPKPDSGFEPVLIPESIPVNEDLPIVGDEPVSEIPTVSELNPSVESKADLKTASVLDTTNTNPPVPIQTGTLSPVPTQDKDGELLSSAQNFLDQNSLDESMGQYSKLIKKDRFLDDVIHDLREAAQRHPLHVITWQTLGDAYMRANRLQDALDAYTKAEELLR
jgi:hypothetical protein